MRNATLILALIITYFGTWLMILALRTDITELKAEMLDVQEMMKYNDKYD